MLEVPCCRRLHRLKNQSVVSVRQPLSYGLARLEEQMESASHAQRMRLLVIHAPGLVRNSSGE